MVNESTSVAVAIPVYKLSSHAVLIVKGPITGGVFILSRISDRTDVVSSSFPATSTAVTNN